MMKVQSIWYAAQSITGVPLSTRGILINMTLTSGS